MEKHFTLDYWIDGVWYVGILREIPGVFSQGRSLEELKENIRDAYHLVVSETKDLTPVGRHKTTQISIPA
jgi:predicted RNase H-like HicB family nuclease